MNVGPVGPIERIGFGELHSCAYLADGSATCWGRNNTGQPGDGTTTRRTNPTPVAGFP